MADPTVAVLVFTHGREHYLRQTLSSFRRRCADAADFITHQVIIDDSGDPEFQERITRTHQKWDVVSTAGLTGFAEAIRFGWAHASTLDVTHIFHLEDDFTFNTPFNLGPLIDILDRYPYLAQLAFQRQPVNAGERAAGGVAQQQPDEYEQQVDPATGLAWLEHRVFWTTNPSLYSSRVPATVEWPSGEHSEGMFSHRIFNDGVNDVPGDAVRCGYLGTLYTPPAVIHIGDERGLGHGY